MHLRSRRLNHPFVLDAPGAIVVHDTAWRRLGLIGAAWCLLAFLRATSDAAFGLEATGAPPATTDWVVRSWEASDGLPQNNINALVQTADGFLWVGASGGLARFDGVRFRTFGLEDGLPSIYIASLFEDKRGVLWVGTTDGVSRWEKGRFRSFGKADGFPVANILALAEDHDNTLWIGTQKGLFRSKKGKCELVPPSEGLPSGQVRAMIVDSKGVLWVSMLLEGIFKKAGNQFIPAATNSQPGSSAYCLLQDRQGSVWAGAKDGMLWCWRDEFWTRFDPTNGLPRNNLETLAETPGGDLWIGARNSGLYVFSGNEARSISSKRLLAGETIHTLLVDREGVLWVGTSGGGLHRFTPPLLKNWGVTDGIDQPHITSVAQNDTGDLWVCTQSAGIYRCQNSRFSKLDDKAVSGNYPFTYASATTADGSLWVAGEQCLFRFRAGQKSEAYHGPPIRGQAIRALCADGEFLWMGTYNAALFKFENSEVKVMATNDSFAADITSLALESPRTLWIGTGAGLYRWENGVPSFYEGSKSLLSPNIISLHRDPDGTLWIGTRGGGLARLKNRRITNITARHGLIDNVVTQIVPDDLGFLWLGSNHGIMRLARQELDDFVESRATAVHPVVIGRDAGMVKEQCSGGHSPTAIKARNGHLLFPTSAGLVEIDPASIGNVTTVPPQAALEELFLDDRSRDLESTLVIPPGKHRLQVSYTAPGLRGADWVRFRYRLDPLDQDWELAGNQRTVAYGDLRPGRYVFQVTACDAKGFWNERPASIAVVVKPAYWQTLWFRGLAVMALCGAAFASYRKRLSRVEMKRQEQQAFTRQLISAQEAERARLARELHDDITQRLARLAIDAGRLEHSADGGSHVGETMRSVREGLVLVSEDVHSLSYKLHPSLLEDLGLVQALQAECEHFSKQQGVPCQIDVRGVPEGLPNETALGLFRIAQEALRNIARHARARAVEVTLRELDGGLQLAIQDNGAGFDPSLKPEHKSLGLASMRERLGLLNGELDVESAPGEGTTIVAWVPVKKTAVKAQS